MAGRIIAVDAAFTSEPDSVAHPPFRRSASSIRGAAAYRRQPFLVSPYTKPDDAGAWKMKLVQELQAADFGVDANKVI